MKAFESSAQRSPLSVTQYFFNLEKRNHSRKTVTKLKIGDNKYVNDQFAILKEEKRFSRNLHANTEHILALELHTKISLIKLLYRQQMKTKF